MIARQIMIKIVIDGVELNMPMSMAEEWLKQSYYELLGCTKICDKTGNHVVDEYHELAQVCSVLSQAMTIAEVDAYDAYIEASIAKGAVITPEAQKRIELLMQSCKRKYDYYDLHSGNDGFDTDALAQAEIEMYENQAKALRSAYKEASEINEIIELDYEQLCDYSFDMLNEELGNVLYKDNVSKNPLLQEV